MNVNRPTLSPARPNAVAFSLVETLIATLVVGIVAISLYGGFSAGFSAIVLSKENMRATQIMMEKVEFIRLLTWDQVAEDYDPDEEDELMEAGDGHLPGELVIEPRFIMPSNFTARFVPGDEKSTAYSGTVKVEDLPLSSEAYTNQIKLITVDITWTNASRVRTQRMQTLFSRYGMQNNIPTLIPE
jgi:type II secretory pathway pseudopilin PulG